MTTIGVVPQAYNLWREKILWCDVDLLTSIYNWFYFPKHVSFEATKRCIMMWMLTKYDRLGKFPIVQALMHFNFNAMLSGDEVSTSLNNYLSVYILMQLSVVLQYGSWLSDYNWGSSPSVWSLTRKNVVMRYEVVDEFIQLI